MTDKEAIEVFLRKEKEMKVRHEIEIKELQHKILELKAEVYDLLTERDELRDELRMQL